MPKVQVETLKHMQGLLAAMEDEFSMLRPHLQEISKYLLPRRYVWLAEQAPINAQQGNVKNNRLSRERNQFILDPTGTKALRDLAAGMMNGVTSPARPWLRLRAAGFPEDREQPISHKQYFDEVARRMLLIMAESNFYNSLAILYLDLCAFGTSSMLIYEDFDEVIRCYNSPVGEFRIAQDDRRFVDTWGRTFYLTVAQTVRKFGLENCSLQVQQAWKAGGTRRLQPVVVCHLIERNTEDDFEPLPRTFAYRETYWEKGRGDGVVLSRAGYREKPDVSPRWELTANDVYGTSPAMDALPDIIQLQHETKRKAQSIDYLVRPPIVKEGFLRNNPNALLPGGETYAPTSASFGAKPIYTVQPPLGEMSQDIQSIQLRIQELFHNDLFRMISSLETVRTATEIDARREEKLVLLGPVLERFENEALDPAVRRVFSIMQRKELLPEPPPDLEDTAIEIQYVSILSDAQRAVGTASLERAAAFVGNLAGIRPEVLEIPDFDSLVRDYFHRLNVSALRPREETAERIAASEDLQATREAALTGGELTNAAKNLSETEVGGGRSALDIMLGEA